MGSIGHTNTAAIIVGGSVGGTPPVNSAVESWNGSSWTEIAEVNTGGYGASGSGTSTAGLKITINSSSAPVSYTHLRAHET